jgi:hypothetical protein
MGEEYFGSNVLRPEYQGHYSGYHLDLRRLAPIHLCKNYREGKKVNTCVHVTHLGHAHGIVSYMVVD